MDKSNHLPGNGRDAVEASPLPVAVGATRDIEQGYHGEAVLVIETARRSERGAGRVLAVCTLVMGVFIFGVGLSQALLASIIKEKEIQVRDVWMLGRSYPMAGDPLIGFLALSVGALFVTISSLAMFHAKDGGGVASFNIKVATGCALLSSLVIFVRSFGERAVYVALNVSEECVHATGGKFRPRGDCVCWTGDLGFMHVNIASHSGMTCDRILEYVGDIRSSYLLMVVSNLLLIVSAVVLLVRLRLTRLQPETDLDEVVQATAQ